MEVLALILTLFKVDVHGILFCMVLFGFCTFFSRTFL